MSAHSSRRFVPGQLAGHGSDLWILDTGRPCLLRRAHDGSTTAHTVPGVNRGSGIVGHVPRWLHADDSGCWVIGADGISHCDHRGSVTIVEPDPISTSALSDGVLATARPLGDSLILRTLGAGIHATVELPAEVEAVNPTDGGFLVFMRTGHYSSTAPQFGRGPWCARVGHDGTLTLGTAWDVDAWRGMTTVVDMGGPVALGRRVKHAQVLDGELKPAFALPLTSDFPPWSTSSGVWMVMRTSTLVHALRDSTYAVQPTLHEPNFTYFRLGKALLTPDQWAAAPGFPVGLALVPDLEQLWISTSTGTFVGEMTFGALTLQEAELDHLPEVPVTPPLELGDPDEWTERQRLRLLDENRAAGMLDIEIDGWFPTTWLHLIFRVREIQGVTFARAMSVLDRDGQPRIWTGAPTLMEWISLDIMESGGLERLKKKEPGRFGYVWI